MASLVIFIILSTLISLSTAEDRVHGVANEGPIAISPEAYAFFHPNTLQPVANNPSLPLAAATVQSAPAHQSAAAATATGGRGIGAGGVAGISVSFLFVCLAGIGVYYVMVKRRVNMQKANPEQKV
ncbi:hypothetical protein MIMGU_mgv1a016347mg [Erythranthe guttata]|uniref:Transmembrane protein n=1 Tax=Erythranthe guttata TaxID=4155 RepID=A0A022R7H1_ERYGU|nr:PREDICTED: uncharacterized protein LOC105959138 [Erythranthe guttata]EYU36191.1 hypothetical protein MIMGU_mgv1a016347mg [Erythranthe guttata]|eukprot:XP_012838636.1 PREDICTED: uncharacterized protein LOC105959138 [Erythranthe guttata]